MRCSFLGAGMKGGRPVSVQCHTVGKLVDGRSFHIQLFLGFVNFYDGQYSRGMYYGLNPARSIRAVYDQSLYSYSLRSSAFFFGKSHHRTCLVCHPIFRQLFLGGAWKNQKGEKRSKGCGQVCLRRLLDGYDRISHTVSCSRCSVKWWVPLIAYHVVLARDVSVVAWSSYHTAAVVPRISWITGGGTCEFTLSKKKLRPC